MYVKWPTPARRVMKDVSCYTTFWLLESIVKPLQDASQMVKSATGKCILIFASIWGAFYFWEIKYKGLERIHTGEQKYKLQAAVNMVMQCQSPWKAENCTWLPTICSSERTLLHELSAHFNILVKQKSCTNISVIMEPTLSDMSAASELRIPVISSVEEKCWNSHTYFQFTTHNSDMTILYLYSWCHKPNGSCNVNYNVQ